MALPATVTLTGTFLDGNGDPASGFVTFSSNVTLRNSTTNETLSPQRVKADIDDGEITALLFVTDDDEWDPVDFVWTVREVVPGRPYREYNIQLPSTDLTVSLEDLAPAVVVDPQYESYALASHTHTGLELEDHTHAEADVTNLVTDLASKASTSHTHDYADTDHNHDSDYSATGHNHDASYSGLSHTHDTRYYTETETDTLLAGKSGTAHNHDSSYFTETEVTTLLTGKSDTTHNHDATYATTGHNHDTRYYTESEVDTSLAGKSDTSHLHDSRYYTETEVDSALSGKANTSHSHAESDVTNLVSDLAGKASTSHTHTGSSSAITLTSATITTFHGTPTAYDRGDGWITLDGGIEATGTNNANTTLATVPSGFRPTTDKQYTMRHTDTSASTGTITINATTGAITYSSAFSGSAEMDFTGIQYRKA